MNQQSKMPVPSDSNNLTYFKSNIAAFVKSLLYTIKCSTEPEFYDEVEKVDRVHRQPVIGQKDELCCSACSIHMHTKPLCPSAASVHACRTQVHRLHVTEHL